MRKTILGLLLLTSVSAFAKTTKYECGTVSYPLTFLVHETAAGITMEAKWWDVLKAEGAVQVHAENSSFTYILYGKAMLTFTAEGYITGQLKDYGWGNCREVPAKLPFGPDCADSL